MLQNYRLAYRADTMVNWCPKLGTVLANDEVRDGLSVRGGYPVEQKRMKQWLLRVTAYAQRMLDGLDSLEWSDSLKEIQRNWIGRSVGAQVFFDIQGSERKLEIFTTRPDTIFGVTFMVIAPEHEWVGELTTAENRSAVEEYIAQARKRSERERIAETRRVSGVPTGSYAINPFTGRAIPIYVSDYVLAGYGTGAIMAVPAHDSRDYAFARHFGLEIVPVVEGGDIEKESYDAKSGRMINSDFLNGMDVKEAITRMFDEVERRGLGKRLVNYRLRDAIFSRQRYWGEPFPIYYKGDTACPLSGEQLPLELPPIENFGPTAEGEPPLARVKGWCTPEGYPYELSTMPGFAGSSAYYLRYMDPHNDKALVGREADEYWRSVDLYVGGIEHATGHLMYSRFWNMFLYDLGHVCEAEPFRKLVNQGMIQGRSNFVYRVVGTNKFVSLGLRDQYETQEIHVDVNIVRNDILDLEAFRRWMPDFKDAEFILEDGKYVCGWAIEKMSKSMFNVVNPDYIVENYGADTLRMYEMFLGPLEQSKPWDTNGIDGVHKFLRRFWRLFFDRDGRLVVTDEAPTEKELRTLHKTIRKVTDDIENFSFNTSVAAFMICLNELGDCSKRAILEPLTVLLAPFAPHIAEELWETLGHTGSICDASYPVCEEKYLVQSSFEYPVSINGKLRFKKEYPTAMAPAEIQADVVQAPRGTEMARRQGSEEGDRRPGQDHQHCDLTRHTARHEPFPPDRDPSRPGGFLKQRTKMKHKTLLTAALSLLTATATARDYGQAATVRIWDNRTAPHSNGITTPRNGTRKGPHRRYVSGRTLYLPGRPRNSHRTGRRDLPGRRLPAALHGLRRLRRGQMVCRARDHGRRTQVPDAQRPPPKCRSRMPCRRSASSRAKSPEPKVSRLKR